MALNQNLHSICSNQFTLKLKSSKNPFQIFCLRLPLQYFCHCCKFLLIPQNLILPVFFVIIFCVASYTSNLSSLLMVNGLNTILLSHTFCCRDVISFLLWLCHRVQSCRYFDGFKMVCETRQVDRTVYVTVLVWVVLWEVIFAIFVNLQYISVQQ